MKKLFILTLLSLCTSFLFAQTYKGKARQLTKEEELNLAYCTGLFRSADGTYFDLLNDPSAAGATSYFNILDWLQGRVAGLQIFTTGVMTKTPYIRYTRAAVFVNEIQQSPDFLNSLPVADIAMIKVIKNPFYGGFNAGGGAIAIYTVGTDDEDE